MRYPIKLNGDSVPGWFNKIIPTKGDPRKLLHSEVYENGFERSISAIKIGSTRKSTRKERHILELSERIRRNVYFLGSRKDIPELLVASDVFVISSEFECRSHFWNRWGMGHLWSPHRSAAYRT